MGPKVTIQSISRVKISDEPETDRAFVTFTFDEPVIEYTVNVLGVSPQTGFVADSGSRTVDGMSRLTVDFIKGLTVDDVMFVQDVVTHIRTVDNLKTLTVDYVKEMSIAQARNIYETSALTAEIDWTELYQEGSNRINIYGRNRQNEWTPYEG